MSIDLGCPPIPPLNTLVECRTATPLRAASRSEQIPPEPPTPPRCARHSGTKRKTAPRAGKKRECKRRRGRNCAPSCRFTPNTGGVSARSMPFPLRLLTAKTAAGRPTLKSAVPGAIWGGWARAQAGDYNMSPPAPPRTPRFSKPRPPAPPPVPPSPGQCPQGISIHAPAPARCTLHLGARQCNSVLNPCTTGLIAACAALHCRW